MAGHEFLRRAGSACAGLPAYQGGSRTAKTNKGQRKGVNL